MEYRYNMKNGNVEFWIISLLKLFSYKFPTSKWYLPIAVYSPLSATKKVHMITLTISRQLEAMVIFEDWRNAAEIVA